MPGDPPNPPGETPPSDMSATAIRRRRAGTFAFEEAAQVKPSPAGGNTSPAGAEPPEPAEGSSRPVHDSGSASSAPPLAGGAAAPPSAKSDSKVPPTEPLIAAELLPIDDAAPTRIINPLIAPTQVVSTEGEGRDLEQRAAAPTVMKSAATRLQGGDAADERPGEPAGPAKLSRVPRSTTSVKRIDSIQAAADERRNTHDLNLLFPKRDEVKKRPPT